MLGVSNHVTIAITATATKKYEESNIASSHAQVHFVVRSKDYCYQNLAKDFND